MIELPSSKVPRGIILTFLHFKRNSPFKCSLDLLPLPPSFCLYFELLFEYKHAFFLLTHIRSCYVFYTLALVVLLLLFNLDSDNGPQVGHLGETYQEWVHQPIATKEGPRFFESDFWEVLPLICFSF